MDQPPGDMVGVLPSVPRVTSLGLCAPPPSFGYTSFSHICHTATVEFSKANPTFLLLHSRLEHISIRGGPLSLSHTVIFTATKISSFLISYFVETFDYCKGPEIKQKGCSKCKAVKIEFQWLPENHRDPFIRCCDWSLLEKTLA